jgi:FMN phosphatase YigB (HAD superfamily)
VTGANFALDGMRAILFDLDGTLRHSRPSYNHAALDYAVRLGVPGSQEKRRRALRWAHYYWANSPEVQQDFEAFDGRDGFLTNYLRRYLIAFDCPPEQAATLAPPVYRHMAETHQPQDWVHPDTPGALERLKGAGYTLGVVSNRREPYQDLLNALGLGAHFEFSLAAGEVNSWKPDVVIFEHALQRAGSCPERTVYVGDNYYADVVGARRAGLQPVLLDPEGIFPDPGCPVICSLGELRGARSEGGVTGSITSSPSRR